MIIARIIIEGLDEFGERPIKQMKALPAKPVEKLKQYQVKKLRICSGFRRVPCKTFSRAGNLVLPGSVASFIISMTALLR